MISLKKLIILTIIFTLIIANISVIGHTNNRNKINPNTIVVDNEGDGNVLRIQDAIDIANSGDIILVYSGTYFENIIIDKTLTLIGVDEELENGNDFGKPVIDGSSIDNVVTINKNAPQVNISHFTITNAGNDNRNWDSAIRVFSDDNIFFNNNISNNNLLGITLYDSSNNIIENNTFSRNNASGLGITLNCPNNIIKNNIFIDDGMIFISWSVGYDYNALFWNSQEIYGNLVNGKPLYFATNSKNESIKNAGQIILVNCSDINISNANLHDTVGPIQLYYSSNITLYNNNISHNWQDGIALLASHNNHIIKNEICNNDAAGIFLWDSDNNTIQKNNISYNGNNSIEYVDIFTLLGGIILIENSQGNMIYENNFFKNTWWQVIDHGMNNKYDYQNIGNFWSDHWYKTDEDNDGISDRPYYIAINGVDTHPLIAPIGEEPDPNPPSLEIELPKEGYMHIGNKDPRPSNTGDTSIIAFPWMSPFEINVRASDDSGPPTIWVFIDEFNITELYKAKKVELQLVSPYNNIYKGKLEYWLSGNHKLTFVCWDNYSQDIQVEMDVLFLYFPHQSLFV